MKYLPCLLIGCGLWLGVAGDCPAQGFIWQLPEDGKQIRFEGTYRLQNYSQEQGEMPEEITWDRVVTIKSVGKENAEFEGQQVPCRWLEIKVVTGKKTALGLNPGPAGTRLYKILVPEGRVFGQLSEGKPIDDQEILISYIPIVKGWCRSGGTVTRDDGQVEDLSTTRKLQIGVFQAYPLVSLLMHYRDMNTDMNNEAISVKFGETPQEVTTYQLQGKATFESETNRISNIATLWRNDKPEESAFGLVKWRVEETRYAKDNSQPRTVFDTNMVSKAVEELTAVAIEENAEAELLNVME